MHNLAVFNDLTWTAFAVVFTLPAALSAINYLLPLRYCWRRRKLTDLVLRASCTFSYFAIADFLYLGVVLEKAGVDLAYLLTREQEIAECLAAIGICIHCLSLCLTPSQCASYCSDEPAGVRILGI